MKIDLYNEACDVLDTITAIQAETGADRVEILKAMEIAVMKQIHSELANVEISVKVE